MAAIMSNMVDIHNHSLPGIDDGARSLEEAVKNITYLNSLGITDIVLTSHYIIDTKYQKTIADREPIFRELKNILSCLNVNLYLGNEVFINDPQLIIKHIKERRISTLNNSKYLLIEFPLHQSLNNIDKTICELNDAGITPIIAHPERYSYFASHLDKLEELLEYDCLLQCNLGSISGMYGRNAKKLVKYLLKKGIVDILATDIHHIYNENTYKKSYTKIIKLIGIEKATRLLNINPRKVISNENV